MERYRKAATIYISLASSEAKLGLNITVHRSLFFREMEEIDR